MSLAKLTFADLSVDDGGGSADDSQMSTVDPKISTDDPQSFPSFLWI